MHGPVVLLPQESWQTPCVAGGLHAATVSLAAAGGWKTRVAMGVSSSGTDGIYNDTLLFLVLL